MSDKLDIPAFETEAEEAAWWNANSDAVEEHMLRKLESGDYTVGVASARVPTTLTLTPSDLTKAKALAEKQGVSYEQYLESLVHRELGRQVEEFEQKTAA
jgi:predicted DNA binding CopG/RHH family protein